MIYQRLIRPLLFRFDPESVHEMAVGLSRWLLRWPGLEEWVTRRLAVDDPVSLAGLSFPNRIGLAAGFDKNAHFVAVAQSLGFGHLEVGAVTPLPQPGHPRPRLFRLTGEASLRNRMGFNNDGLEAIAPRLPPGSRRIRVGVNVGKGAATPIEEAARDYLAVVRGCYSRADYFSINISSPNTADLRQLGRGEPLLALCRELGRCGRQEAERLQCPRRPILIKVSPDSSDDDLKQLAAAVVESELDGLIATNTTTARGGRYAAVDPLGGLSGVAVYERSLKVVRGLRQLVGPHFPIIGVGGVVDVPSALAMREAGADLVQIYTGFVYGGPLLPSRLARALKGAA